jgi:cation diffusion facilitator CzcD-associated flavoprotein CzcO
VEQAAWDDEERTWTVTTSAGTVSADVLVTGSGGLSEPKLPGIAGIDSFAGEVFHSSRWNHDYDLTGKRVAVIGTGASAIQIVPAIAERVGHLDVYQRTAPWVMPRSDRAYTAIERLGFRFLPGLQRLYRTGVYWGREGYVPAFTAGARTGGARREDRGTAHRERHRRPALRAKVTPDYRLGCKRVLISNDYYPALDRDDVDLVTDGIREITPTGIVTADGTEREVDCLIVATGFHTTDQPIAHHIKGSDGRSLADAWRESGMMAYKGTTVAGFPNLFQIVGPNTGLGHSSMVFVIESQIAYIVGALRTMEERGCPASNRGQTPRRRGTRRCTAHGAHGLEHRRLLELVPRRARPQHRAVAAEHLHAAPAPR